MHEAGVANAIAATIREAGLLGGPVRVLVTGGHDAPPAFDAAVRFHLSALLPELAADELAIVHLPAEHWCADCGETFEAVWDEPCPRCGGPGLMVSTAETIEVEGSGWAGSSDPSIGDRGPSASSAAARHADGMEGHAGRHAGRGAPRPDGQVT